MKKKKKIELKGIATAVSITMLSKLHLVGFSAGKLNIFRSTEFTTNSREALQFNNFLLCPDLC